jgi:hypothetical protein
MTSRISRSTGAIAALGAALSLLAACSDLASPDRLSQPEAALASAALHAASASASGPGAWIIREDQDCFLPGIDADGMPYPLFAPCSLQLVLTGNGRDVASGTVKGEVPNDYGRAVRLRFGPISPFPCLFLFDTDGDGVIDLVKETTRYTMLIAASGQLSMTCQFPDGG